MNIIDHRKENVVEFGDLNVGSFFEYLGVVYRKVQIRLSAFDDDFIYTSIRQYDGFEFPFTPSICVTPVSAVELHIY